MPVTNLLEIILTFGILAIGAGIILFHNYVSRGGIQQSKKANEITMLLLIPGVIYLMACFSFLIFVAADAMSNAITIGWSAIDEDGLYFIAAIALFILSVISFCGAILAKKFQVVGIIASICSIPAISGIFSLILILTPLRDEKR